VEEVILAMQEQVRGSAPKDERFANFLQTKPTAKFALKHERY
jgi:hypothetical protein